MQREKKERKAKNTQTDSLDKQFKNTKRKNIFQRQVLKKIT